MDARFPRTLSTWYLRLLLAALLMFGSELLLWTHPLERPLSEWLLLLPGYAALAALMLDIAVRYRLRDVYDVMILAAIYGLLAGLLLNPQTALALLPDTVVTRILGGHTLLGAEMFGLLLALTDARSKRYRRLLLLASLWLGFYWGIWVRWSPVFTDVSNVVADPVTMSVLGVLSVAAIFALVAWVRPRVQPLTVPDLSLSIAEWGGVLVILIGLFMLRVAQGTVSFNALALVLALVIGCMSVLWFRRSPRGKILLDGHIPPVEPAWRWLAVCAGIFLAMSAAAYSLPLVNFLGITQFSLMTLGFAGVGLGWLPLIAMILGVRTLDKQARTDQL